jgi:hypothetical protein
VKSLAGGIGSINLRGKKTKTLSCGCCAMEDLREKYAADQARREIRSARLNIMESDAVKSAAVEVRNELKAFSMLRERLKSSA